MLQLANSLADVVCLQEIWLQQDIMDLAYAARSQFPYYHTFDPTGTPGQQVPIPQTAPCQGNAFSPFLLCVNASCSQQLSQGLQAVIICSIAFCDSHLSALSQQCLNCLGDLYDSGNSTGMAQGLISKYFSSDFLC